MATDATIVVRESLRAKRVRIAVYENGDVVVVKPKGLDEDQVQLFIESRKDWIREKLESRRKSDAQFPRDTAYTFLLHKPRARLLAEQKIEHWNRLYQFPFRKIEIKRMKSRWGSCSGDGVLCFNYRMVFLPEELQDYLIVHELCHLAEMNHSAKFWKQVARALPDYAKLKKMINS